MGDDVHALVQQPLRVLQVVQVRRNPEPSFVRLIDEGAIDVWRHVIGTAGDVDLDDVGLLVRVAVHACPGFFCCLQIPQTLAGDKHSRTLEGAAALVRRAA